MRPIRLLLTAHLLLLVAACAGDGATAPDDDGMSMTHLPDGSNAGGVSDATVFQRAGYNATDWAFYRFSTDTLDAASTSPHAGRIRTRYNVAAQASLDSLGKVDPKKQFADGSMIAKEVYSNGRLTSLAVMYKLLNDPNAGHGGWLWGEYGPGGAAIQSVTTDGSTCHDCHVVGIDHTRMNDSHP